MGLIYAILSVVGVLGILFSPIGKAIPVEFKKKILPIIVLGLLFDLMIASGF